MSDWTRSSRRATPFGSAGYGTYVPLYDRKRVEEVIKLIADHLASSARESGQASLADSVTAVLAPLRLKGENLPSDGTFDQKLRWHPTYVSLKSAKKLRGGRR